MEFVTYRKYANKESAIYVVNLLKKYWSFQEEIVGTIQMKR